MLTHPASLIALSLLPVFTRGEKLRLFRRAEEDDRWWESDADAAPDCPPALIARFRDACRTHPDLFGRARREADFCAEKGIEALDFFDAAYPPLLRHCADAPLLLFYLGNAPLTVARPFAVIGTRQMTAEGAVATQELVRTVAEACPQSLLVSGLAYGIDITAHRAALAAGLPTVAVLAHGLRQIYPATHRSAAAEMTRCGGLLTEYLSDVAPRREHFLRRNRIVAGMTAATVLTESRAKGGTMVTAALAHHYHRPVFVLPRSVENATNEGARHLLRSSRATLLSSVPAFLDTLSRTAIRLQAPSLFDGGLF